MVQGTEVTRLINVHPRADRWSVSLHALILLSFAATTTYYAQAQNIEGQPIAAQYGEFEVQNEGNGFAFDPANCNVTGGGENFPAFTTGTPVKVVDALPAQTEVSTTVIAFLSGSNCAVSLGGLAYQHTSFYLTSGTGGLQEALNNEKIRAGGNNTIILNSRWYELIAPRSASTVISTVSGSYSFGLVDITTNPYTSYNWNGSQYVQAAPPGGSPSGAAGGALSGNYANPGLSSNPVALPAGSTATTCTPGENDTKVATNACVAATASSGGPPSGTAGGSLSGSYPNPAIANPLNLSTGGTFGSSNYASYLNSFVTGSTGYTGNCALTSTWYKSITSAVNGCVSAPASGTGTTITNGGIFSAYTQDANQEAVGLISNGYAYANGTTAYSQNPLVTDAAGLTSNVVLVGQENDLQPLNPTSAYLAGVAFRATLAYTGSPSNTGNYPFDAFTINTNVPGAYWRSGLTTYVGAFSNSFGTLFNINANGTATSSSGNYNCPTLLNAYEAYWTGSANANEGWTMGCNVGPGSNPTTDNFKLGHAAGTAPAGQTHTFELANGIQLQLDGSTSGSASLSASATGGALNITAPAFVPSIGSILQADGFNSYAGCVARGAWSSSTVYNNCDTVTYGGATWIAVHGSTNVTPVQSSPGGSQVWLQFRSDGANVPATQADYAFFWAYGLVNTNSTSFSSNAAVSLVFGAPAGGYLKNGDWVEPNNTYGYTISLIGQGRGQTTITQSTSTLNYMLVQPPISSAGGEEISGIEFNANLLAAGCLDVHIRRATYRDLVCFNPQFQSGQTVVGTNSWNTPSTASTFLFGQAADAYELHVSDILTRTPTYSGIVAAQGTATVTSGAITAITYTNTGTNLNLPAVAGAGLVAYFFGKGPSSTSFQPCATMPVVSSIALTGGSINTSSGVGGITFTSAGTSCGGTIYVLIKQAGAIPYGYYIGSTDSSYENLVSSGDFSTACELVNHGANVLNHEHPYCQAPYQIYASGGGTNQGSDIHSNTEFDSPIQYGAYIKNGGEIFTSWSTEWNSNTYYAGAGDMLLDTSIHDTYIGPNWCGPWQEGGGYAKFTGTAVGPITSLTAPSILGVNNSISGNQPLCDGSGNQWGSYVPNATLASPTFTGTPTAPTQPATDNSTRLATTAGVQTAESNLIVANVRQYGAVGNGTSNQACTYLSLANLAALQAYDGGIYSFATSCTNQMDWLATQYAVNKLTSTGGSVKLSGGPYIWDQPVILPNSQDASTGSAKGIYLLGDGEGGTLIEPAVADFGANSGMVSCGSPTASYSDNSGAGSGRYGGVGACYGGISDISFYNPYSDTYNSGANVNVSSSTYARGITNVPAPGYSGSPIQMDGVLLGGRMNLKRVGAWGFRMGFNLVGDHMTWDQIDAEKNFCGLYWAPASIYLVGDIILQGHSFVSGNTFAGTCVDKDASIIGFYQSGEYYTGYQPYGFIKFPGISDSYGEAYGGAYTPFFANANYDIIQSEAIGNAVMWDDNLTTSGGGVQTGQASIGGVKINGIYTVFASASGQKITTGGRGPYAYFGSGSLNGFRLGNIYAGANNFYPTTGQLAGIIANNAAYNDGGIDISGDMNNILNQYTAIEFVGLATSGSTMCQDVALHEPGVWDGGEVAIYPAATEPAAGNLLQVFNYQAGTIANGTEPVIGVAEQTLSTNTAGGQCVAYANHGTATVSTASAPALGALLVATTAGQATAATASAGGYIVGTVHNNITNPPVVLSPGGFTPGTNNLSVYAALASPSLTGTPTAPTAAAGTNSTQLATTAYAQNPGPITPTTVTASGVVTAPGLWPQSKASGPYAVWFDDFLSTANNSLNQIPSGNSGTCSANNTYADANHPGNILLNSFTTSGDGVTCGLQSTSGAVVGANTSAGWMWETEVYVPVLPGTTAGAYQAGLSGTPNASPWTNGISFYLSSANTTANDWYIRYGSTAADCSIAAVAATWTRLTMVNDGTNVHWYVNGTQCGTGVAIGSMPSNTMYAASWSAVTLTASTAVTMAVDYVDFQRAVSR